MACCACRDGPKTRSEVTSNGRRRYLQFLDNIGREILNLFHVEVWRRRTHIHSNTRIAKHVWQHISKGRSVVSEYREFHLGMLFHVFKHSFFQLIVGDLGMPVMGAMHDNVEIEITGKLRDEIAAHDRSSSHQRVIAGHAQVLGQFPRALHDSGHRQRE